MIRVFITRSAIETVVIAVDSTLADSLDAAEDAVAKAIVGDRELSSLPHGMRVIGRSMSGDEESSWEAVDAEHGPADDQSPKNPTPGENR